MTPKWRTKLSKIDWFFFQKRNLSFRHQTNKFHIRLRFVNRWLLDLAWCQNKLERKTRVGILLSPLPKEFKSLLVITYNLFIRNDILQSLCTLKDIYRMIHNYLDIKKVLDQTCLNINIAEENFRVLKLKYFFLYICIISQQIYNF